MDNLFYSKNLTLGFGDFSNIQQFDRITLPKVNTKLITLLPLAHQFLAHSHLCSHAVEVGGLHREERLLVSAAADVRTINSLITMSVASTASSASSKGSKGCTMTNLNVADVYDIAANIGIRTYIFMRPFANTFLWLYSRQRIRSTY